MQLICIMIQDGTVNYSSFLRFSTTWVKRRRVTRIHVGQKEVLHYSVLQFPNHVPSFTFVGTQGAKGGTFQITGAFHVLLPSHRHRALLYRGLRSNPYTRHGGTRDELNLGQHSHRTLSTPVFGGQLEKGWGPGRKTSAPEYICQWASVGLGRLSSVMTAMISGYSAQLLYGPDLRQRQDGH